MKKKKDILKAKIQRYLKKEQLFRDEEHKKLEKPFIIKARKSFGVANLLFKISEQEDIRKLLNLASDFETYDWVIIISYYSIYSSALSALSHRGYKSKSHAATIAILENDFVSNTNNGKKLEAEDIHKITKAYALSEQLITKLIQTKTKRETAQYDATPSITKEIAKTSIDDADAMTNTGEVKGVTRMGIIAQKSSILARATFETPIKQFINATIKGSKDKLVSVIENIIINQPVPIGTGLPGLLVEVIGPLTKKDDEKKTAKEKVVDGVVG